MNGTIESPTLSNLETKLLAALELMLAPYEGMKIDELFDSAERVRIAREAVLEARPIISKPEAITAPLAISPYQLRGFEEVHDYNKGTVKMIPRFVEKFWKLGSATKELRAHKADDNWSEAQLVETATGKVIDLWRWVPTMKGDKLFLKRLGAPCDKTPLLRDLVVAKLEQTREKFYPVSNLAMILGRDQLAVKGECQKLVVEGKAEAMTAGAGIFSVTCYRLTEAVR